MKLGIFGGTFDPIHRGHLQVAGAAKEQFGLDKILFVPAKIPPHKLERTDITPAEDRSEMVRIAIAGRKDFELSTLELDRAEISYTVDTLKELRGLYPDAGLYLLIGADCLKEMPGWRDPEGIRARAKLLVAPRSNESETPAMPGVSWIKMPLCPESSTEIRRHVSAGEPAGQWAVPEVMDYIQKRRLYSAKV